MSVQIMETESGRLLQTEMLRPVSCKTAHNGGVGTCVLLCRVALRLQQKHDVIYKCCMLQCNTDSNQFFNQHVTMYVSVWPVIESHKNASTVLMFNLVSTTERTMWKCIQCCKFLFLFFKSNTFDYFHSRPTSPQFLQCFLIYRCQK